MTDRPLSFTVRAATANDAAALGALRSSLFRELGNTPPPGGEAAFDELAAAAFRDALKSGSGFAWLAETGDGHAVGSVALLVFPRLPSPSAPATREGYLLSVFTAADSRGHGVATALVAAAVAKARALGLGRIRLHATPKGRSVYAAAGFVARVDEMELRLVPLLVPPR